MVADPCARFGWSERQQGFDRTASALRHPSFVVARCRQGSATALRRSADHEFRRHRHQGAALSKPGKESNRRARTASNDDRRRGVRPRRTSTDPTDARFTTQARRFEGQARTHEGRSPEAIQRLNGVRGRSSARRAHPCFASDKTSSDIIRNSPRRSTSSRPGSRCRPMKRAGRARARRHR